VASSWILFVSYQDDAQSNTHQIFTCPLSANLEASTFWNSQGLPRPLQGWLYFLYLHDEKPAMH